MVFMSPNETMERPALPTVEGTQEARWRDCDGDQLRVVHFDGKVCIATGIRRTWVSLSPAQAAELVEFLQSP